MRAITMGVKAAARALARAARSRVGSLFRAPAEVYRPDLTDVGFIERLPASSGLLSAATSLLAAGDLQAARHNTVEHFLQRAAPRFFIEPARVGSLASVIRHEHAAWVELLKGNVEADLRTGLGIVSTRGAPLRDAFDWARLPVGPGDDRLFSVQPHRFGFMPGLALAEHHGIATSSIIDRLLERWITVTDAGDELSYLSPLVVLYRVIALTWTFTFVAGLSTGLPASRHELLFRLLKILHADGVYLDTVIGSSYPNNHLLADGFSGWYLGSLYPEFATASSLRRKGEAIFLRELSRQFYDDGANFEHSTHYHELGCEMAVAYVLLSKRNAIVPAPQAVASLRRMLAFQAALSGVESLPMAIGDTTEDPLFPLDARRGWAPGAMRAIYRALFDADVAPPPATDPTVERAWWLLGDSTCVSAEKQGGTLPTCFAQGGFYLLPDLDRDARLLFRSGPLEGMPISAGHAHSDVLSVYLTVRGQPLIVSSGTGTYRFGTTQLAKLATNWRAYLAGPESHNGLISSGDPYDTLRGDFREPDVPCRVRRSHEVRGRGLEALEFEVTGTSVGRGHRRGVVHVHGCYWVVYDIVPDELRAGGASIALQFAPEARAVLADDRSIEVSVGHVACTIALGGGLTDPVLLTGSRTPLGGWVSPRYGEVVPAPQLRAEVSTSDPACALVIQPRDAGAAACVIRASMATESCIGLQIQLGAHIDTLLIGYAGEPSRIAAWDVESAARLAWLRAFDGKAIECRAAGTGDVRYRGKHVQPGTAAH